MNRKELGALGEKKAAEYLKKKGYRIRETNFRCREGEIDIIAQDKDYLVFVEVRTRTGSDFGTPEESVTAAKKDKLVSLALAYLQTHHNVPALWRFDVVAIEATTDGRISRIDVVRDAI
ncbi:MAG: YraN family protein [Chloroflexi bacterium]|nr:MAG: YraN family protein [Chloroflexota bacterium]